MDATPPTTLASHWISKPETGTGLADRGRLWAFGQPNRPPYQFGKPRSGFSMPCTGCLSCLAGAVPRRFRCGPSRVVRFRNGVDASMCLATARLRSRASPNQTGPAPVSRDFCGGASTNQEFSTTSLLSRFSHAARRTTGRADRLALRRFGGSGSVAGQALPGGIRTTCLHERPSKIGSRSRRRRPFSARGLSNMAWGEVLPTILALLSNHRRNPVATTGSIHPRENLHGRAGASMPNDARCEVRTL